ncbi:hypothetical protein [Paraburkholderia humisilvae]|uniref:Uncharacterized protein n=1 Tax=Paraburkholderia humisilvae TaxID=627669 RepID=A0A6J5FBW7_9BURK|nr:hypothetical protein [Paraburkholderia humisilvae]CAB3775222.1 hypothetical protein LMG29542_08604 [Paraburkholderia humisilvae]
MKNTNSLHILHPESRSSERLFLSSCRLHTLNEIRMTKRKPKILTRNNAASRNEFLYYARSLPMRHLCRTLQRHERTVKDWMKGHAVIPSPVLRLQALEFELMRDQMGYTAIEREQRQARRQETGIRPQPAATGRERRPIRDAVPARHCLTVTATPAIRACARHESPRLRRNPARCSG